MNSNCNYTFTGFKDFMIAVVKTPHEVITILALLSILGGAIYSFSVGNTMLGLILTVILIAGVVTLIWILLRLFATTVILAYFGSMLVRAFFNF